MLGTMSLAEQVERFLKIDDNAQRQGAEVERRILKEADMGAWLQSEAYVRVMVFIQALNASVVGKPNSSVIGNTASANVVRLSSLIQVFSQWVEDTELLPGESRFGNKGFAHFVERVEGDGLFELERTLAGVCPENSLEGTAKELHAYLMGSFGHKVRLDYGSGHELAFVAFLCCLNLVGFLCADDYAAVVLLIFNQYLELCRKVQLKFRLEPAGSHGVWGLDDHQFLPYYFGSAQLLNHPRLKPKSFLNTDIYEHFASEYLFMRCIKFIHESKRGPFHEHSPLLYDISGVPSWTKVNSGMLKMFNAEVMEKFPVVQHFVFGNLLPFVKCKI